MVPSGATVDEPTKARHRRERRVLRGSLSWRKGDLERRRAPIPDPMTVTTRTQPAQARRARYSRPRSLVVEGGS
jgi:hypothetical protein